METTGFLVVQDRNFEFFIVWNEKYGFVHTAPAEGPPPPPATTCRIQEMFRALLRARRSESFGPEDKLWRGHKSPKFTSTLK